jgi:hypothetical protein
MTTRALGKVLLSFLFICCPARAAELTVELVNNHAFDIHQPVRIRNIKLDAQSANAQQLGDDLIVIANVAASQGRTLKIPDTAQSPEPRLKLEPTNDAISLGFDGKDLGTLAWDVIVHPADKDKAEPVSTKRNFDESFEPLPLKFERSAQGPLFDTWSARADTDGVELVVELHAYHSGYLDSNVTFTNRSAPTKDVYAAVLCRWSQPQSATVAGRSRTINCNNEILPFPPPIHTAFREGTERHLFVQRGVDWINTPIAGGGSVAWLNDFTPSFTVHKNATAKTPARWLGANTAQLAQEAQATDNALYSITEIARPNIKSYRARLDDNVLPQPNEDPLTIVSRLIFSDSAMTDQQVDNHFVSLVSYRHLDKTEAGGIRHTFGVPFTRFGTNYFPYSTLGENFITKRIPNMSKEGYWPLSPETVNQWPLFVDDVRRDLRILKAMGFEISRLHHFELLWDKNPKTDRPYVDPVKRQEYLDFYFGELKNLGLKALLDIKISPEETAELVAHYKPQIEGVEIDNEIVLFMIPDNDVQYWKNVYAAVKQVAPEIPVHLTGHTNTGAFNRLIKLGVPFDKVGAHAYMDAIEAIPSARGYSLAVADYASELNKEPVITEWNWRFLTRMTFEERAKVYPPIFENVLKTRCMPTMYQFQFQDSLAMNPTTLKGMRRYEQILLSRRPKPEALEMMKLITKYGSANHPNRLVDIPIQDVEVGPDGRALLSFKITNTSGKPLQLSASVDHPQGMQATIDRSAQFELQPSDTAVVPVQVSLANGADAKCGFYHVFLRLEGPDNLLRYGWAIVRKPGAPTLDKQVNEGATVKYSDGALDFDFNRPLTVVYSKDCTPLELESAWTLFITLESATGREVEIYQDDKPGAKGGEGRGLILVGADQQSDPTVKLESNDRLIVTGKNSELVAQAAMDLTLRYWMHAKDSVARRVGLVEQPSGKSGVKTDLE